MDIEKLKKKETAAGGKMLDNVNNKIVYTHNDIEELLSGKTKDGKKFNQTMKEKTLTLDKIDFIAKVITNFAFCNGFVEDKHASNGQLTQEDVKLLNKTMQKRIAYIFTLIAEDRWTEFNYLISMNSNTKWDIVEPDYQEYTKNCQDLITTYMATRKYFDSKTT